MCVASSIATPSLVHNIEHSVFYNERVPVILNILDFVSTYSVWQTIGVVGSYWEKSAVKNPRMVGGFWTTEIPPLPLPRISTSRGRLRNFGSDQPRITPSPPKYWNLSLRNSCGGLVLVCGDYRCIPQGYRLVCSVWETSQDIKMAFWEPRTIYFCSYNSMQPFGFVMGELIFSTSVFLDTT